MDNSLDHLKLSEILEYEHYLECISNYLYCCFRWDFMLLGKDLNICDNNLDHIPLNLRKTFCQMLLFLVILYLCRI